MKSLVLLLALFPCACAGSPDERMIRQAVSDMTAAAQRRDSAGVARFLSPDFRDGEGRDREGFRRLLEQDFRGLSRVYVFVSGLKVRVTEDSADVSLKVALSGSSRLWPERGRVYETGSVWRRESGRWVVVRAWWARAPG